MLPCSRPWGTKDAWWAWTSRSVPRTVARSKPTSLQVISLSSRAIPRRLMSSTAPAAWSAPVTRSWSFWIQATPRLTSPRSLRPTRPWSPPAPTSSPPTVSWAWCTIRRAASRNGSPTIPRGPRPSLRPGILTSFSRNQNGGSMKVSSIERSQLGRAPGSSESDEPRGAVMQDFTLVIPTYNRPKQLEALLTYLAAQQPQCHVLILDSSQPKQRQANRKIAGLANLKLKYAEFPS